MVCEDFRTVVPWWTQPAEHNPYDESGRTQGENPVGQGAESGGVSQEVNCVTERASTGLGEVVEFLMEQWER